MIAISESQENAISFPQMHRGSAYPDHTPSSPTVLSLPHPFCRGDLLNAEVLIGYAREIRDEVLEHAFVFDQQGRLLKKLIGERTRIQFGQRDLFSLTNTIFLHNHPGSSSFSLADLECACVFEMRSMMVVSGDEIHILLPPAADEYFSRRLLRDIVRCFWIRSHLQPLSHQMKPYDGVWKLIASDLSLLLYTVRID
ncbi:MAG: hypothetical protein Q7J09_09620 [Methanocalculus sp.]|uniref:hypothetical protein n=1 Tax=Methanocalculus sp. TaxID=2004547 RepID=UPI00272204DB|nr:hypothetical protein [Methanocalculus sp.]MDO9540242.1 hypothetical protein [Methanocalculus sp.]